MIEDSEGEKKVGEEMWSALFRARVVHGDRGSVAPKLELRYSPHLVNSGF